MLIPDQLKTHAGLSKLLHSAFTPDEFRRFVATHEVTSELSDDLTDTPEDATFFFESAGLLVRRGVVEHADFWVALQAAVPHRELVPRSAGGASAGSGNNITIVMKGPKAELSMALVARIEEMLRLHAPGAEIERVTRGSLRVDVEQTSLSQLAVVQANVAAILPPDVALSFEFPRPDIWPGGLGPPPTEPEGLPPKGGLGVVAGLAAAIGVVGAIAVVGALALWPARTPDSTLIAENQTLEQQVSDLQDDVATLDGALADATRAAGERERENDALKGRIEVLKGQVTELEVKLDEKSREERDPPRLWTVDAQVTGFSARVPRSLGAEERAALDAVIAECGGTRLPPDLIGKWAWVQWDIVNDGRTVTLRRHAGGDAPADASYKRLAACLTKRATRWAKAGKVSQASIRTIVVP